MDGVERLKGSPLSAIMEDYKNRIRNEEDFREGLDFYPPTPTPTSPEPGTSMGAGNGTLK